MEFGAFDAKFRASQYGARSMTSILMAVAVWATAAAPRERTVPLSSRFTLLTWNERGEWSSAIGSVEVRALPVPGSSPSGKIVKLTVSASGRVETRLLRKDEFWGQPFYGQWCALSPSELVGYLFEDVPSLGWKAFGSFVQVRVVHGALVTDVVEGEAAPAWYVAAEQRCRNK